jgi:glutamate 5-kinase
MRSKVAAAEMASEAGIPATICNGTVAGTLAGAAAGEAVGTRFAAQGGKAPSFKLWLKYAKPAHGRLLIDEGAAHVLRARGSSLLPVGVTGIEGDFEAGDAVEVAVDGSVVGKGIVDYSATELAPVIGKKSSEVRDLLPNAPDEVIHRDRFVLL